MKLRRATTSAARSARQSAATPKSRGARRLRRPRLGEVIVVLAIVGLAAGTAGGLARVRVQTGIDSFLPSHDSSVTNLNTLAEAFGGDPVVVLMESKEPKTLIQGQSLLSLVELEGKLSQLPDVGVVYGPGTILNQIASQTQDLLAELSGRRDAEQVQAEAEAKAKGEPAAAVTVAGKAALDAFDARYGPLIVQGLPAGLPTLSNSTFAESVIFSGLPQPRAQWRFVVPSASSVAILVRPRQGLGAGASERLVAAVRSAVSAAHIATSRTTISGTPALVAALSHDAALELPVLGAVGIVAVAACFLLVPWTRRRRRLLPLASTVAAIAITLSIYGWLNRPLSLGVAAFLPVLLGIGSYYPTYFALHASRRTVFAVALGTAASFSTLVLSPLPFVRDLGITLALGVVLSASVGAAAAGFPGAVVPDQAPAATLPSSGGGERRGARVLLAVVGAAAIAGWALLPGLSMQPNFEHYAAGLPALSAAEHVEKAVGSSGELDISLSGPNVLSVPAYRWMLAAQNGAISTYGGQLHPVVSPPTLLNFLGADPTATQIAAGDRFVPAYLMGAAVLPDHTRAVLSFGVNLTHLTEVQHLISGLRASLPPPPQGFQVQVAGLPVVAARGVSLVSHERLVANVLGIAAATAVLSLMLKRRSDALRACAAATIATGLGLFLLWLCDVGLSPMTIALGALTAAVACEFTVMLAEARRRGQASLRASVLLALATSVVGYLSLTASRLTEIREFGLLLAAAVLLAFLSALTVVRSTCPAPAQTKASLPETNRRPKPTGDGRLLLEEAR